MRRRAGELYRCGCHRGVGCIKSALATGTFARPGTATTSVGLCRGRTAVLRCKSLRTARRQRFLGFDVLMGTGTGRGKQRRHGETKRGECHKRPNGELFTDAEHRKSNGGYTFYVHSTAIDREIAIQLRAKRSLRLPASGSSVCATRHRQY
jgi:hypothetical protein